MIASIPHQYIDRDTSQVVTESLYADRMVQLIYSGIREKFPLIYKALLSPMISQCLGFINFDLLIGSRDKKVKTIVESLGINLDECLEDYAYYDSPRRIFERQIDYPKYRPMSVEKHHIASPADAKMLIGSFETQSSLFIKEKFFTFNELIGPHKQEWNTAFRHGDFAIFRLTPDKYHYNHAPVTGIVLDHYEISGVFHSCNPGAIIQEASPLSKNKRVVSIIDTDVENGTGVGLVCMIEVTALMIGEISQAYSEHLYDNPKRLEKGMLIKKGQPKSLYLPGSSVDVLIFQKDRVVFSEDIRENAMRYGVSSRYSEFFGRPVVETDVRVRSTVAEKVSLKTG